MSLMLIEHFRTGVTIFTDTEGRGDVGGRDVKVTRPKVWALPEMNAVMTGIGCSNLIDLWFQRIPYVSEGRDIEALSQVAPAELRRLHAQLMEHFEADDPFDVSATIHMYGFPRGSDECVGYIYRHSNQFVPERHVRAEPIFLVNPPLKFDVEYPTTVEDIISIAEKSRAAWGPDGYTPAGMAEEVIRIGGTLIGTWCLNGVIQTMRMHQFPDSREPATPNKDEPGADESASAVVTAQ